VAPLRPYGHTLDEDPGAPGVSVSRSSTTGVATDPPSDQVPERKWTAVAIDEETPWVRDYRGLWGYDTRDPFGGKRAPAGPRYERDGSTRLAWDRPVAWAGLDKVPPTRADELTALQRRAGDVELELGAAEVRLADEIDRLRSLHEGMRSSQLRERTPQRATSPPRQRSRPPGTRSRACRPSRKRWRMLS
jgi:hypothetical protein